MLRTNVSGEMKMNDLKFFLVILVVMLMQSCSDSGSGSGSSSESINISSVNLSAGEDVFADVKSSSLQSSHQIDRADLDRLLKDEIINSDEYTELQAIAQ